MLVDNSLLLSNIWAGLGHSRRGCSEGANRFQGYNLYLTFVFSYLLFTLKGYQAAFTDMGLTMDTVTQPVTGSSVVPVMGSACNPARERASYVVRIPIHEKILRLSFAQKGSYLGS